MLQSAEPDIQKGDVLGVYGDGGIVYLFYKSKKTSASLSVEISSDGQNFTKFKDLIQITDPKGRKVSARNFTNLSLSRIYDNYFLGIKTQLSGKTKFYGALGRDFDRFNKLTQIPGVGDSAVLVPNFKLNGKYWLLFGAGTIKAAFSADLKNWEIASEPVIKSFKDFFGENPLMVANAFVTDEGILLIYYVIKTKGNISHFEIKAAVLNKENPLKVVRHIENLIWESPDEWIEEKVKPLGIVKAGEAFISFWKSGKGVYSVSHPTLLFEAEKKHFGYIILNKIRNNPIIGPIIENLWESKATFNPAAIYEEGKVHIIYRAVGEDDVSVLGYATSFDGVNIDERLSKPIYVPTQPFESSGPYRSSKPAGRYESGGGCYGGCEDPRITKIDDKIYMTYVAYDGWNPPRVALTSIKFDDFINHRWEWEKPVLISKPGVVDKNACLLPEKIGGKYVIFHRIFPDILVDFVDDLNFDGNTFLEGQYKISPRKNYWDSRKVGAGAPPIKTKDGWLLIYQAVGDSDASRYKVGAMILDINDPTRVVARSNEPILGPDQWYENEGFKAGVAYPCGAVAKGNQLIVYYGGADTVVCAATARLDVFVSNLKHHRSLNLSPELVSYSERKNSGIYGGDEANLRRRSGNNGLQSVDIYSN